VWKIFGGGGTFLGFGGGKTKKGGYFPGFTKIFWKNGYFVEKRWEVPQKGGLNKQEHLCGGRPLLLCGGTPWWGRGLSHTRFGLPKEGVFEKNVFRPLEKNTGRRGTPS